jgi:hypothetical protein
MKIREIKLQDENLIIAGLILSDDYIRKCAPHPVVKLLENDHTKLLAGICFKYYRDFGTAPKQTITEILPKQSTKLKAATFEMLEGLVEGIQEQFFREERDFDLNYALKDGERYLNQRNIEYRRDEENNLAANYEDDKIWQLKPLQKINLTQDEVAKGPSLEAALFGEKPLAMSFGDYKKLDHPPQEFLMHGSLPLEKATITLVVGPPGGGKTFFLLTVAKTVAGAEAEFAGLFHADTKRKVCYVDGELSEQDLIKRTEAMKLDSYPNLSLISKSWFEKHGVLPVLNLVDEKIRESLSKYFIANEIELVIFDNIYSLCGGMNLDKAEEWSPINDWACQLRSKGIASIWAHHQNKSGTQHGTGSKEWNINNFLMLSKETPSDGADDVCCFSISIKKQRDQGIKLSGRKYIFRNNVWSYESKKEDKSSVRKAAILSMLADDKLSQLDMAKAASCTAANITKMKKEFAGKLLIENQGGSLSLSQEGEEYLAKHFKEDFKEILNKEDGGLLN